MSEGRVMPDSSGLDKKYFIDNHIYNCPFCHRNNVMYRVIGQTEFDWTETKKCYVMIVECSSCKNHSMHLSYQPLAWYDTAFPADWRAKDAIKDSMIFYSVPTSFFVLDNRIPKILRELIVEAEGCLKMNFLTGASACMRKAIYEMIVKEEADGTDYESKIKYLKEKYKDVDPSYFDILAAIQDMTSDKIHEQSWDKWDSEYLRLIIDTLKNVIHEVYVVPKQKKERAKEIHLMREKLKKDKKGK